SSDVANATRLEDALSIDASQTTCLAPCGIHFKAAVDANFDVPSNFHHLAYHWDFGDEGSYFQSLASSFPFANDANSAQGPQAGHVFEAPGTYNIVLRVAAKNGRFSETVETVTVLAPTSEVAAESVICASSSAQFEECPLGSIKVETWQAVIDQYNTGASRGDSVVLFRAGDEFSATDDLTIREGRHVFTRFGDGPDPIIRVDDNITLFYALSPEQLSVSYIEVIGTFESETGLGDSYRARGMFVGFFAGGQLANNVTAYRTRMSGIGICFYPSGGIGQVYADNECTNFQDYGSLQNDTERTVYVGNSFRQSETAKGGPDAKNFSITIHLGDGTTLSFPYDFSLASDADLGIRIVDEGGARSYFSDGQGYSLDLAGSVVSFDVAPAANSTVEIFHRRWADHGPIRAADAMDLVVSQNDLFSNVGWFGDGLHHSPALRYNTDGLAGHSGVIVQNHIIGGTTPAVFEPANSGISAGLGEVLVERNWFQGSEPSYKGVRSRYGNVTFRNNLITQPDILSTTNAYWSAITFHDNNYAGTVQDPNLSARVEVYNNTVVNLATDAVTLSGATNYRDFDSIVFDDGYGDVLQTNNLTYAPKVRDISYHSNPNFDDRYSPANPTSIEPESLPGLFDTIWGDLRPVDPITGAVE
ncbi:MAG: PKD domain-containing protein, partial [Pseudomonadota bacterium]